MTSQYTSFLQSLESFIGNIKQDKPLRTPEEHQEFRINMKKYFFCIWGNIRIEDYDKINFVYDGNKVNMNDLLRDTELDKLIKRTLEDEKFIDLRNATSFDGAFVNKISSPTFGFFTTILKNPNDQNNIIYLKEELTNIFFRLTQYAAGSFVPLIDLISDKFMYLFNPGLDPSHPSIPMFMQMKYAFEGIYYTLMKLHAELPAPYYYKLAVFERTDQLNQILRDLESSLMESTKI